MTWDDALNLTPARLEYLQKAISTRRAFDRVDVFRAVAATISPRYASELIKE